MAAAGAGLLLPSSAYLQQYPAKPIRLVVPYSAGGGTDTLARLFATKLGSISGQSMIVENRPGAGGVIASEFVAKSAPDGYTLLLASSAHAINQTLYQHLPYDTDAAFVPIGFLASSPNLLVTNPALPVKSVADLIALAKSKPGQLNFGSGGAGSIPHLGGEMFKRMAGIEMQHIAYRGGAVATNDLIAGHLSMMFGGIVLTLPYVKSGQLRAIAVTSKQRIPALRYLPTVSESGLEGFELEDWFAVFAPAGTPASVVEILNTAIRSIGRMPDVQERYQQLGAQGVDMTSAALNAFVRAQLKSWAVVIKAANVQID